MLQTPNAVRALVRGARTQARRLVKPQPKDGQTSSSICPLGGEGDRIWVKETIWVADNLDFHTHVVCGERKTVDYDATMNGDSRRAASDYAAAKTSALFMPKWAARIWLEIVDVDMQRLQDITPADIEAEGLLYPAFSDQRRIVRDPLTDTYAKEWDESFGDGCWAKNPWVWVLQFKPVAP